MRYSEISQQDYDSFHRLATAYYREGEDADTPQETLDSFIRFLFDKLTLGEIHGFFAKEGDAPAGFALWALDTENFAFSEMPGRGTILEIGLLPEYRGQGQGGEFVRFLEENLRKAGAEQCYVCAYGPAQGFWTRRGYAPSGKIAANGLPILIKSI